MEYILYSLLAWLILTIAGFPFCLVAIPASIKKYSLQFGPLLGFCYFTFSSYYLYRLNIGGTDAYAIVLFLVPVIALVVLCTCSKSTRANLIGAINWESAGITGLVTLAYVIVSAPFFVASSGHALASSMNNLDIAELAVVSRYLQEFIPNFQEGFLGQNTHIAWTCKDIWFGPSAIVALISSLIHAEPYQLQTIVMDVIAVQTVAFVFLIARRVLDFGWVGAAVLALLYTISPVPLFTIWQSFGGQMLSMSLMLALFFVQTVQLKQPELKNRGLYYLPTTIILFTGIILCYHFMVLVSGLAIAAFIVCYGYFSKQWREAASAVLILLLGIAACALLNPLRVMGLVNTLSMLSSDNGWFIQWISPDVIMGANSVAIFTGIGDLSNRSLWISVAAIPFLVTMWHLVRSPQAVVARSFFCGLLLPTFLIGLWLAFREQQNGVWGSYRSFKITASFSALTLLGGAIAFAGCNWSRQRVLSTLAVILVSISATVSALNTWSIARFTREHAFIPGAELIALKKIESMPFVKGINVMEADAFSLLWTNYFTLKTHQVYQKFPYGGRPVGVLNQEYSLAKTGTASRAMGKDQDIFSVESTGFETSYAISKTYALYKAQAESSVSIAPADGWWPAESTHRWSGSKGDICSIFIDSRVENIEIFIEASYLDMPSGRTLSCINNGSPIRLTHDKNHMQTERFRLQKGRNLVVIRTSFLPEPPSSWDPRTLSLAWTALIVRFPPASNPP